MRRSLEALLLLLLQRKCECTVLLLLILDIVLFDFVKHSLYYYNNVPYQMALDVIEGHVYEVALLQVLIRFPLY